MRTLPLDPFDSSTWTEDERYYFETVEEVLEGRENIIISNGKPEHAVYLIRKFLTLRGRPCACSPAVSVECMRAFLYTTDLKLPKPPNSFSGAAES